MHHHFVTRFASGLLFFSWVVAGAAPAVASDDPVAAADVDAGDDDGWTRVAAGALPATGAVLGFAAGAAAAGAVDVVVFATGGAAWPLAGIATLLLPIFGATVGASLAALPLSGVEGALLAGVLTPLVAGVVGALGLVTGAALGGLALAVVALMTGPHSFKGADVTGLYVVGGLLVGGVGGGALGLGLGGVVGAPVGAGLAGALSFDAE